MDAFELRSALACERPQLRHLVACLTAAFGLSGLAHSALASSVVVTTCTEDALRSAVALANADSIYDTIDLTGVGDACSTITLANGEIPITAFDLTLLGPTDHVLTIDAAHKSRVFRHSASGTVEIDDLTLANGSASSVAVYDGAGGCFKTHGSARLVHSAATGCAAGNAGGAVYAISSIEVRYSSVTNNTADAAGGGLLVQKGNSLGAAHIYSSTIAKNNAPQYGGIYSATVLMTDSVVSGNMAGNSIVSGAYIMLTRTTVSGNASASVSGYTDAVNGTSVTLLQSTVDDNTVQYGAGIHANSATITNSTVSSNFGYGILCSHLVANNSTVAFNAYSGISVLASADLTSTIAANNARGTGDLLVNMGGTVSASHSLIAASNVLTGSLTADPQLTPLAYHGGPTRTHALQATSPAVNAGSNPHALTTDQRGTGFARIVGASADIGAYERQLHDDEIFYGGFD